MNKNKNQDYSTTSFYLAVFLLTKSLNLIGIDRTDVQRSKFQFAKSPQWDRLIEAFNFAKENDLEIMVDARKFIVTIKSLKEKLYQDRF